MNPPIKIYDLKTIKDKYIKEPYDSIVDLYFKKHFDEKSFDKYIDKFASLLPKKAKVLDIGCGPGGETKKLLIKGFDVLGIDISEKMLAKARLSVPNTTFTNMDMMTLDFPNNYFDGIWSARTLIHVPTKYLKRTISGFRKVLKPNGIICLIVLAGKDEGVEPEYYDPTGNTSCFFKYFQEGELDRILEKLDFTILKSHGFTVGEEKEPHLLVAAKKSCLQGKETPVEKNSHRDPQM